VRIVNQLLTTLCTYSWADPVISVLSILSWILVSPEVLGDHKGALCLNSHWSDLTVSHGVLISQAIHLQAQCYCHSEGEPAFQG
jgi:hypothetical protein